MNMLEERAGLSRARVEATALDVDFEGAVFGIAHEIGNLIQAATSALNIISRSPNMDMGSEVGATIASARVSLERARTLVQQMMQFARKGGAPIELVDVWDCLMEIEALISDMWDRNIRLELYAVGELPTVTCSRVGLQSAIMNLLLNAGDAMPDGGVVSIIAAPIYEEHVPKAIELRLLDTGLAMTEDVLRQASELYFTTKMLGLGGLGLPMMKRVAQEAGGHVDLESEPGGGTTVGLRLPIPIDRMPNIDTDLSG
jgi:signal transduction histidine kinase